MKKFRTVASVIIMVIAGIVGFFIGAFLNEPTNGWHNSVFNDCRNCLHCLGHR